ncbi:hypothetical protein, partial [Enterococcus faecium]
GRSKCWPLPLETPETHRRKDLPARPMLTLLVLRRSITARCRRCFRVVRQPQPRVRLLQEKLQGPFTQPVQTVQPERER